MALSSKHLLILFISSLLGACSGQANLTPKQWALQVEGYGESLLSENLIFGYVPNAAEGGGGRITAVDLGERAVLWSSDAALRFDSSQIVAANAQAVFVFLNGKGLHIYDRQGQRLAVVVPEGPDALEGGTFGAAPTLLGTHLLIPTGPYLYAYDVSVPSKPVELWRRTFQTRIWSLTVDENHVYVGGVSKGAEANILKLSAEDGRDLWQGDLEAFGRDQPAAMVLTVAGEQLLAYTFELFGTIQAVDRSTGERLWTAALENCRDGAGFASALEVGGGMVFVSPSSGSCLYAVDLSTGKGVWTYQTGSVGSDGAISIGGKPLYYNGVVYTSVEKLWALDAESGKVLSFASEPAYNTTDTIIHYANGEILVWGDDLTAYKPVR